MALAGVYGHALDLKEMPDWQAVPALGARRRVQALAAIGHSIETIAATSDLSIRSVEDLAYGTDVRTVALVARLTSQAYDILCGTPGRCGATRTRAEQAQWGPPLAWDDIDDPAEVPKFGSKVPKYVSLAENYEDLRRSSGLDRGAAAERLGVNRKDIDAAIAQFRNSKYR